MIKKLKKRFILLATISMFVLMAVLVGIMNVINYTSVVFETDSILNMLEKAHLPFVNGPEMIEKFPKDIMGLLPRGMSPEVPYESRYFIALISENGVLESFDVSKIISVDLESVNFYVQTAYAENHDRGFIGQFRYAKDTDGIKTRIIFLDCGRKLDSFYKFMWTSITVGLLGCLSVFVVFLFAAGRIIRPIAESYEKQKRFITDAGHEIKTPLTIIGTSLDLLESDVGESEYISDIRTQTKRLGSLTNDLVYLSRMEENSAIKKISFSVSDLVKETSQQFQVIAHSKNKVYQVNIEPDITMFGVPDAICQLISVLLDNAMKYSPEGGVVTMDMKAHKKMLHISVFNTISAPLSDDNISRLFDRFYRTDDSRNSETGGYGIGLSIAKAVTAAHGGKISAETQNGSGFRINIELPLQ